MDRPKIGFMTEVSDLKSSSAADNSANLHLSKEYGKYFDISQELETFGEDVLDDNEDGIMHFIIYSTGDTVYAWDPVRRTRGRVIGTNFTNI